MRWLILYGVRLSLCSDSIRWAACSSSTPGIASPGHWCLPLGSLNHAHWASPMEQVQSSAPVGTGYSWSKSLIRLGLGAWAQSIPALGPRWTKQQAWPKRLSNAGAIWPLDGKLRTYPHKVLRILRKSCASGFEEGWRIGKGFGFFPNGWALGLEKKLLDCGVVWQGSSRSEVSFLL